VYFLPGNAELDPAPIYSRTSRDRIVYDTKEDLVVYAISAYARASNRAALVLRRDMLFRIPDACTRRGFTGVANLVEIQLLKVRKSLVSP
jgi:hypothetical protein